MQAGVDDRDDGEAETLGQRGPALDNGGEARVPRRFPKVCPKVGPGTPVGGSGGGIRTPDMRIMIPLL